MATFNPAPSIVSEVEEILMCPICFNPLVTRQPRTLQCLHTFCTPCLQEIVSKVPRKVKTISCPTCRENTKLPQGKVKELRLDFAVEQMNDMVRSLDKVQSCNSCWTNGNFIQADIKCLTCERRFCERCCDRHDGIPGFQSHPKLPIVCMKKEEKEKKSDVCSKHGSEYLRFCSKCKLLMCVDCLMRAEHDDHQDSLVDIAQTADDVRSRLSRTHDELKIKISESKLRLEMYVKREDEFQTVKQEIMKTVNEMKRSIDSQRDKLLQELKEKCFEMSQDRIALLTDISDKSHDLCQAIGECADKSECEIIQYHETMMMNVIDLHLAEAKLGVDKEPPFPTFNRGSEPKVGKIVFENKAPNETVMIQTLQTKDDVNDNTGASNAKLLNRFGNLNIHYARGVGALSNGRAVVVTGDGTSLLLVDSQTGCLSKFTTTRKITRVSTYKDRILYIDYETNCVFELGVTNNTLAISREYTIPRNWASYSTFDSSGNILVTLVEGESNLRKYNLEGRCLWKTNIKASSLIRVATLNQKGRDMHITAHADPPGVMIWNEDGKQRNTLDIVAGKNGEGIRGVTVTPAGTILVADHVNHMISEYAMGGSFIRHVVTEDDGINGPWDISCDSTGLLWVTQVRDLVVFKLL